MTLLLALLLAASPWPDPWAAKGSGDVVVVSTGEAVVLEEILVPGKFTVVDVGAPWCSPCHDAARSLRGYAEEHPDTAIRVVSLEGPQRQSWSLAAAVLAEKGVLPWLLVFDPEGEQIYAGSSPDRALSKLDRTRDRTQRRKDERE